MWLLMYVFSCNAYARDSCWTGSRSRRRQKLRLEWPQSDHWMSRRRLVALAYAFPDQLVGLSALKTNAAAAPPSSSAAM